MIVLLGTLTTHGLVHLFSDTGISDCSIFNIVKLDSHFLKLGEAKRLFIIYRSSCPRQEHSLSIPSSCASQRRCFQLWWLGPRRLHSRVASDQTRIAGKLVHLCSLITYQSGTFDHSLSICKYLAVKPQ